MFDPGVLAALQAAMAQAQAAGMKLGPESEEWFAMHGRGHTDEKMGQGTRVSEEERARMEARRCFVICEAARARGWRARFVQEASPAWMNEVWRVEFWDGTRAARGLQFLNKRAALMGACNAVEGFL